MAKKKLTNIAEEYGLTFEEAQELVFKHLDEETVTGRGKNTWINEEGQTALDDVISMPVLYRGKVLSEAPNRNFLIVYIKDILRKVPVRIPARMQGLLVGKMVYVQAETIGEEMKYKWVRTPIRG
jgi:hypothetical protein|tara:strand:+ start:483 stop:857 length:375 start_codon:yes stop_codon:yes gene_type:complete